MHATVHGFLFPYLCMPNIFCFPYFLTDFPYFLFLITRKKSDWVEENV
jgi:hypothetical protein